MDETIVDNERQITSVRARKTPKTGRIRVGYSLPNIWRMFRQLTTISKHIGIKLPVSEHLLYYGHTINSPRCLTRYVTNCCTMDPDSESDGNTTNDFSSKVTSELYDSCVEPTYVFNRASVQDMRQQRNLSLRAEVSHALNDVHNALSMEFDQSIYRADTGELLIMLALRHLDELPEVAADIGIGVSLEEAVNRAQKR